MRTFSGRSSWVTACSSRTCPASSPRRGGGRSPTLALRPRPFPTPAQPPQRLDISVSPDIKYKSIRDITVVINRVGHWVWAECVRVHVQEDRLPVPTPAGHHRHRQVQPSSHHWSKLHRSDMINHRWRHKFTCTKKLRLRFLKCDLFFRKVYVQIFKISWIKCTV